MIEWLIMGRMKALSAASVEGSAVTTLADLKHRVEEVKLTVTDIKIALISWLISQHNAQKCASLVSVLCFASKFT